MSTNLMDTVPGGESDQYSSQQTFTEPHSKSQGQLGDKSSGTQEISSSTFPTSGTSGDRQATQEKGERTAENVRYGQAISEQGFGGTTTEASGAASGGGGGEEGMAGAREVQGYGGEEETRDDVGA